MAGPKEETARRDVRGRYGGIQGNGSHAVGGESRKFSEQVFRCTAGCKEMVTWAESLG